MRIKAIGTNLIVEPIEGETKTESGLYIPDTATERKPKKGVIVSAGKGWKDEPVSLIEGDIVHFAHSAGNPIELDGKTYRLLKPREILGYERPSLESKSEEPQSSIH